MFRVRFTALVALLTLALLWPSFYNLGPIWFFDTFAYFNGGKAAIARIAHVDLGEGQGAPTRFALAGGPSAPAPAAPPAPPAPASTPAGGGGTEAVSAGRSVYFGIFLTVVTGLSGLWGAPVAQSTLFAAGLVMFLWTYLPNRAWLVAATGLAVAGLTAAPLFTSYLMPDFLAGLAVLALVRLVLPPARSWPETLAWAALLFFALVSHVSHLLVAAGLLVCAVALLPLLRLPRSGSGSVVVAAVLMLAVAAEMLFTVAVSKVYSGAPQRPPFLAARMIADGPGMTLLAETCTDGAQPYVYCRYMDRLPMGAITFLWAKDPAVGVYGAADAATRQQLSAEQMGFARDVLRHHGGAELRVAFGLFGEQLARFGLGDFAYTPGIRSKIDTLLPPDQKEPVTATRFYAGTFDLSGYDRVTRLVALAAGAVLVIVNIAGWRRGRGPGGADWRALQAVSLLIVLACLGNAAVTGILSEPFDRYQARIAWLPLVAAALQLAALRGPVWTVRPTLARQA